MKHEEFRQLLEAYTFNEIDRADQQRLAQAVVESPEWAQEFAQAHEMREQLGDPRFRAELLKILDEPREEPEFWWRTLLQPKTRVLVAGGVAASVIVSVLLIRDSPVTAPDPAREPPVPTQSPRDGARGADDPAVLPPLDTLSRRMPRSKTDSDVAFERNSTKLSSVKLMLSGGSRYLSTDTVFVRLELPVEGRVYAFVRGPSGTTRQVYPEPEEQERVLSPGPHVFAYPAVAGLDGVGGVSTLRVFIAPTKRTGVPEETTRRWIAGNAEFAQAEYTVGVPR